jgi:hypothetical protein
MIRLENPEGRYWTHVIGDVPSPEDGEFVGHRSSFVNGLVEYNELKEVRKLRRQIVNHSVSGDHKTGEVEKYDLGPEIAALHACMVKLHKKLKL